MPSIKSSPISIYLITEGPTDRKLLSALISQIIGEQSHQFIPLSSTQRARSGKQAILGNFSMFSKYLHHGFHSGADIIVICIDNDDETEYEGIGINLKNQIKELFEQFLKNNSFYEKIPCLVCAVPVKTMDYWMKAISVNHSDCRDILTVLTISKDRIKEETYGKRHVFRGQFIDAGAIEKKTNSVRTPGSLEKLRCLPSFKDFEEDFITCLGKSLHMDDYIQ